MACPGLATHTLAGLCAQWLLSSTSSPENLHKSSTPQPPQITCPAKPRYPVEAPSHLLYSADAAFDLEVHHGIPRAGHSHTGRALCAVVADCCLLLYEISTHRQNGNPKKPPAQPCRSPQCRLHHPCCTQHTLYFTLQCSMACPGLATHTLAGLYMLWLLSAASSP